MLSVRSVFLFLALSSVCAGQTVVPGAPCAVGSHSSADCSSSNAPTVAPGPKLLLAKADASAAAIAEPGPGAAVEPAYTAAPVIPQTLPEAPKRPSMRKVYALALIQHSAAALDAWSTRRVLSGGGVELNPMLKPFAHSDALYPALQVWPSAMDYVGYRMSRSNHRLLQRGWWIPQVASTAVFATFAARNAAIAR